MYSLALDSIDVSGTDTLLFNFFDLNDSVSHFAGCGYLGGDECFQLNKPSWAGRSIRPMADGGIQFHNAHGDTLDLMLPTTTMDTGWFYSDVNQRFGLTLIGSDTASFLGILDSARTYQVVHLDQLGDAINSPLSEAPFTICKTLGLVEFFQVDSFPTVLRRLRMIGDAEQQIGLFCITDASIHDYQVGDEIQYRHSEFSVFPTITSGYYLKVTVLSRTETDTNVAYEVEQVLFPDGSAVASTSLATHTYSKSDTVSKIPFESFNGTSRSMYRRNFCGSMLWVYTYDPDNMWDPCPWGPCWSPYVNGKGPNPVSSVSHIIGVGSGHDFSQYFLPVLWDDLQYVSHFTYIPYFVKNGVPCGAEVSVGIGENLSNQRLTISPVPSDGRFTLQADSPILRVDVMDLQGRNIRNFLASGSNVSIDLGDQPNGMYMAHVLFLNGTRAARIVMVVH